MAIRPARFEDWHAVFDSTQEGRMQEAVMVQDMDEGQGTVSEYVTIEEAVLLSGYTEQYIRRMARRRKIGALKFGHFWMVHRESLAAYLRLAHDARLRDGRFGPRGRR